MLFKAKKAFIDSVDIPYIKTLINKRKKQIKDLEGSYHRGGQALPVKFAEEYKELSDREKTLDNQK